MRAIAHLAYGGPESLVVTDLPTPVPAAGQVLVRVHAASINAADYRIMRADPFLVRLENGWTRPRKWPVLGSDFAGEVVEVGDGVDHISVGENVFGDAFPAGRGAFAEYVCVPASAVVTRPPEVSASEASGVPLAGITALQALRDAGLLQAGEHVLVHGAGGGVGGFVVQIAKARGARVTAVCSAGSAQLVRAFGADTVINYAEEDFAEREERYDVIVAVNGRRSMRTYRDALADGGRLVVVGGTSRQIFEGLLLAPLVFLFSGRSARTLSVDEDRRAEDLGELRSLLAAGQLRVVVDRTFPLTDAEEAMRYVERGHVRGKVVLRVMHGAMRPLGTARDARGGAACSAR